MVEMLALLDAMVPPVPLLMGEIESTVDGVAGRSLSLLPGIESIAGLPGAVAVHRGARRWKLPGERVLELIGDGPPTLAVGQWTAVALEDASLDRGESIAGFLAELEGLPGSLCVWIDPAAARRLADQTAAALEAVPIIGAREARRWRALAVALEPLARAGWLTAAIAGEPTAVRLRLALKKEPQAPTEAD